MQFDKSMALNARFHAMVPGGSHTYAKGDDQFPGHMLPYIVRGKGSHVWDLDGNEFIEYGMGLRAVTLGHGFEPVVQAAHQAMAGGTNFIRPAAIEITAAEAFLDLIDTAHMVKFCKDGSDATSGAVRLARAFTGRDMVARCANHPFFAVDDWFIGTTPMSAGIPESVQQLTTTFKYNDMESVRAMFEVHPDSIACVILEPEKYGPPEDGFLHALRDACHEHGAVFVLDEMITGFRWHDQGCQRMHDIVPDLSTWGKGMSNGFAVSALSGKKEIMELGGLKHDKERVWLMSGTHGAETHGLAAMLATLRVYQDEPVIETMWTQGKKLADGVEQVAAKHGLQDHIPVLGRPCCVVFGSKDESGNPSQPFRTLLIQENLKRGVMTPSLIISYSHTDEDIERTIDAFDGSLEIYARALEDGVDEYLEGRPVQPVWRKYNGLV
jgi:glutamate-1-semialdehyde 2,1-aminomutase